MNEKRKEKEEEKEKKKKKRKRKKEKKKKKKENLYMAHKNFHGKPCLSTAPDTHTAYTQAFTS